jgi:hypothetical protein
MSTRTHWQILHSVCAGVGIAVVTSAAASSGDEALAVEELVPWVRIAQGLVLLLVSSPFFLCPVGIEQMPTLQPHIVMTRLYFCVKHFHRMQHQIPGVCIETAKKLSHGLHCLS